MSMRVNGKTKKGTTPVQAILIAFIALVGFLLPSSVYAESADVEATIKSVDMTKLALTLDDGKTYQAPEEFNFEGLKEGVKVIIYYTEVDGKRVIDDLHILQ